MKAMKIIESAIIIVGSTNTGYLYHRQHITYGFAKLLISTYRDCSKQQFERLKVKPRVITISTEISAFESICEAIKGLSNNHATNYDEAVRKAYQNIVVVDLQNN
jgi:hypothetical protein